MAWRAVPHKSGYFPWITGNMNTKNCKLLYKAWLSNTEVLIRTENFDTRNDAHTLRSWWEQETSRQGMTDIHWGPDEQLTLQNLTSASKWWIYWDWSLMIGTRFCMVGMLPSSHSDSRYSTKDKLSSSTFSRETSGYPLYTQFSAGAT